MRAIERQSDPYRRNRRPADETLPMASRIIKAASAYDDLVSCGSVAAAREKGLYRMEGKEYVVKDGDVLLFKFNV